MAASISLRPRLHRLRRAVLLRRRLLAALAGAVCLYAVVVALSPPPPRTQPVWTVTSPVAAGEVLSRAHLRTVGFLPETVPDDAVADPREVIGRPASRALAAGDPVAAADVVGRPWLGDQGSESVVPVRLSDPAVVALLRAGDTVDILATDPSASGGGTPALTVARGVRVVSVPQKSDTSGEGALPGRLVLLGVPEQEVGPLTRASAGHFLTVAWIR